MVQTSWDREEKNALLKSHPFILFPFSAMIHNSWDSFLFSRLRQTTVMQTISASGLPKRQKLKNTEKRFDWFLILLSFNLTYDLKILK